MEEMNNNINPNQQPQPQKEEEEKKKKNKFVAWWLGLGKWAKVGICAGTAAVLATAITLPIVLTKKPENTPTTFELVRDEGGVASYGIKNISLKKNLTYTFKASVKSPDIATSFGIMAELKILEPVEVKDSSGKSYYWIINENSIQANGSTEFIEGNAEVSIQLSIDRDVENVDATLECAQ